jgi:type IV pilus assembly protein PilV
LVTIVLLVIGLLGLAALQSKTSVLQMEAYQRAQALMLAQDMADRIAARKVSAAGYVGNNYGTGAEQNCSGLTGYALDTCNWGNAIRGASERLGADRVGTLVGGRGCIINPANGQYAVVVVWQGLVPTAAPGVSCGLNSYGTDTLRRAVVVPIGFADLIAS